MAGLLILGYRIVFAVIFAADILPFKGVQVPATPGPADPPCTKELSHFDQAFGSFEGPHLDFPQIRRLLELGLKEPLSDGRVILLKGPTVAGKSYFMSAFAQFLRLEGHPYFFAQQRMTGSFEVQQNLNLEFPTPPDSQSNHRDIRTARETFVRFRTGGKPTTFFMNYIRNVLPQEIASGTAESTLDSWAQSPPWLEVSSLLRTLNLFEYEYIFRNFSLTAGEEDRPIFLFDFNWQGDTDFVVDVEGVRKVLRAATHFASLAHARGGAVVVAFPEKLKAALTPSDEESHALVHSIEVIDYIRFINGQQF